VSPTEPKIKFDHIKEEPDIKCSEGDKKDFTFEAIDPIPNDNVALPADIEEQIENILRVMGLPSDCSASAAVGATINDN